MRAQGTGLSLPPAELGVTESNLVHQVIHSMAYHVAPYHIPLTLLVTLTVTG